MAFNTSPGRAEYTAAAAQTIFTFTFKIFETSDIKVYLTPAGQTADDTEDILIETTDYTISINGDNGGDVTLTSGATLNDAITLVRDLPVDRDTEYQQNGDLTAGTLNEDQDYQTYLILDGSLKTNERALIIPDSAQGFDTTLPAPGADKMFIYAPDGKSINLIDPASTSFFKDAFIVDSMQELLIVDENTYGSVNVRGYYTKSDGGGDLFNWDSAINKSTANAGTIIDPSVSLANQGSGTGFGCWVRQYSGLINAIWFGAFGDGVDRTSLMQKALDLSENNTLIFQNGTYLISAPLEISNNTTIKSASFRGTTILHPTSLGFINKDPVNGNDGIEIQSMAFDAGGTFDGAMTFTAVENVLINNCKITNVEPSGVTVGIGFASTTTKPCSNISITNCDLDVADYGVILDASSVGEARISNVKVYKCNITTDWGSCVSVNGYIENIVIEGNAMKILGDTGGVGIGVKLAQGRSIDESPTNVSIVNNSFIGRETGRVDIKGISAADFSKYLQIANNTFENFNYGFQHNFSGTDATNITFTGNNLVDCDIGVVADVSTETRGIYDANNFYKCGGAFKITGRNVVISNNSIRDINGIAIELLSPSENAVVASNLIDGVDKQAIIIVTSGINNQHSNISGNNIRSACRGGDTLYNTIQLNDGPHTVANNTLKSENASSRPKYHIGGIGDRRIITSNWMYGSSTGYAEVAGAFDVYANNLERGLL